MKTEEHMRLDAHCEELHAALDEISKVLRIPYMSKVEIRRRIAQIIVKVRKAD